MAMILPALLPTCNLDRCLYDDVYRRQILFFSRLSQRSRSAASKSHGGKIAKATRLHLDDGDHFFRSAGTPEFDGVWISDSMWMSMGPTMLTSRSTVESLQASLEALVFHCSRPCLVPGEVMFFESLWLVPK
jgi:hypothetical protein